MNRISTAEIMDGARDYRLMTRQFKEAILEISEYNRFSKGIFGWVGFKTKWIEFENVERKAGETKWSFGSSLNTAWKGLLDFLRRPGYGFYVGSRCMLYCFSIFNLHPYQNPLLR